MEGRMATRTLIRIDEDKCDGCGLCADACHEGAIAIIDGKARLVSETYCDGLGACIGECPQGAITLEQRDAAAFDAQAVARHLASAAPAPAATARPATAPVPSALQNWPVQLHLAPIHAPFFRGARLLVAADCVPFALADFHSRLLDGRVLLIGCPKLDDVDTYVDKLTAIVANNDLASIEVAFMEVPCCFGLVQAVKEAVAASGKRLEVGLTRVGIRGEAQDLSGAPAPAGRAFGCPH
jgi:NAD-dependent dihydropyrimidine dehydrogenase PreA subunit